LACHDLLLVAVNAGKQFYLPNRPDAEVGAAGNHQEFPANRAKQTVSTLDLTISAWIG
jgi:hypothetical protein